MNIDLETTGKAVVRHPWLLKNDCRRLEELLETHGFSREVAGEDFGKAVKAIRLAFESGRGLFVVGQPGCGKTTLLLALHRILSHEISRWVAVKVQNALRWLNDASDFYYEQSVFIDDIGAEEVYREYGNVYDVVGDFIQRFHANRRRGAYFYGTSNLGFSKPFEADGETVNHKYGSRVYDRICEDCIVLLMGGKTKRKPVFVF